MDFDFDFEDMKPWLIGIGIVVAVVGTVLGMTHINVNSAIEKCKNAGYGEPSYSLTVSSCPADDDYASDDVALVVGNTANTPAPALTDELNKYLRNSLAKTEGDLKLNIYSATPGGQRVTLDDLKVKRAGSAEAFIKHADKTIHRVSEAIKKPADEKGADYFNNIVAAGRAVTTSPSSKSPLVMVVGSGLSDTQPLNFANGDLLHAEPMEVLEQLKKSGTIAAGELQRVKIVWSGLGVTTTPQDPLDATEKRNLRNIYAQVFRYMGADFVTDDTVVSSDSVTTNKPVSPVRVNGISGGVVVFKLGESSIGFKPGTATIQDDAKANQALDGVVANYDKCRSAKITIDGYTARPTEDGESERVALSQSRAAAVQRLLVARGVGQGAITVQGKGSGEFDGRVAEMDGDVWNSEKAQANRVVIITMDTSGGCNG